MKSRKHLLILTFIFGFLSLFLLLTAIIANQFPAMFFFIILALFILSLCLYIIQPQLKYNDERMKMIKSKTINSSFFFSLLFIVIGLGLIMFTQMDAEMLIFIIISLIIITSSLSLIVFSKLY